MRSRDKLKSLCIHLLQNLWLANLAGWLHGMSHTTTKHGRGLQTTRSLLLQGHKTLLSRDVARSREKVNSLFAYYQEANRH